MRAKMIYALLIATLFLMTGVAGAQLPIPANTQFDVTGFIQAATLDSQATTTDANCKASLVVCGGSITVNHQKITVPSNTILQMPAAALTWQQVFALNPLGNPGSTGLAMADCPPSGPGCLYGEYEAHVVGNRVGGEYIAGLIFLSQHSLQSAGGFINDINYSSGELRVGGTMGTSNTGMRVRINDPIGRFGPQFTPDARFTIDENNPTVRSDTGYPMCIPRAVPPAPPAAGAAIVETDPLCPSVNRPVDPSSPNGHAMILTMATPAAVDDPANVNSNLPDPRLMAPFEVGDYVTYSGILLRDATGSPYIAAYQMIGNVGLYTTAGVDPAYVATDVMLLGVGGNTVAGATEATIRTRFEGFTSDPSRNIVLSGVDVNACTGQSTLRDWGHIGVDPGGLAGAVLGRWRFRPPCKGANLGSVTDKVCLGPAAGSFLPPTREMRSSVESFTGSGVPAANYVTKNGLNAGAYQAPIFEFLFPENAAVGSPIVPNNFEDMPFLAQGSGPLDPSSPVSSTNPIIGQLSPWPSGFSAPAAPPVCANALKAPIANAGPNQTVSTNAAVTLTAAASSDPNVPALPLTYAWVQTGGTNLVSLSDATAVSPTFTAPATADALSFQVTVSNGTLSSTANVNVTVTANAVPGVTASSNLAQIASGGSVVLTATATGTGPFTYKWSQTAGPLTGTFAPSTLDAASITWSAPAVATNTLATFSVIATNVTGDSAPATVSVTVNAAGAPVIGAIAAQSVAAGSAVTIPVSATSTNLKTNLSLAASANTLANFKINNGSKTCAATSCTANWTVTFTAPSTAQTINLGLTATDSSVTPNVSSAVATATVTVTAIAAPTNVSAGANQTVTSGANFTLSGSSTGATSVSWTLVGSATVLATTPSVTLKAPTVTSLPAVVQTYQFTATNAGGSTSATVTVTVVPVKDTITISLVEYRTGKQRLTVDATSSSQALAVQPKLTMQAFKGGVAVGGVQNMTFSKNLNLYEVIVVGSVLPDSVTVTSTYGGSASSPVTKVRQ